MKQPSQVIFEEKDYGSFGSVLVGRSWSGGSEYRYGFNGKESDSETYGEGNIYDYGFRIYNSRLGKFLSVDPLTKSYPWYTPYQFAGNQPIRCIDLDGLEEYSKVEYSYNGVVFYTHLIEVSDERKIKDLSGNVIKTGIYVRNMPLTSAQFVALGTTGLQDPNDWIAGTDYSISDIQPSEGIVVGLEKENINKSSVIEVKTFVSKRFSVNFAVNSATVAEVQNTYNSNPEVQSRIDIAAHLMIAFPSSTLEITGNTDASPAPNYISTNPSNPDFGNTTPDGNVPLSYDRADALGQFINTRIQTISGNPSITATNRMTIIGAGSTNARVPATATPAERAPDRNFTTRFKFN